MAVYNGADYLDAQLSSFAAQTHKNWQLLASDDGSSDASHGCLERLQANRATMGFVSSNSWDINGAASAGLTTFWIQRTAGEPPEELGFGASRVVRAITDLAPLVRG